jgi:hypothetical protein
MTSPRTLRKTADHFEKQVYEMQKQMAGSQAVSQHAHVKMQQYETTADMLRQEAIRIEKEEQHVIGPFILDLGGGQLAPGAGVNPFSLMSPPDGES